MIASILIIIIFLSIICMTYIFSKVFKTEEYEILFYIASTIVILIVFLIEGAIR